MPTIIPPVTIGAEPCRTAAHGPEVRRDRFGRGAGAGPVVVRPAIDAAAAAGWAGYVEQCPQGTLFHHPDWCAAVEEAFGHRPRHLVARRGERIVGVLPLLEINSVLAGRMLVSVPYGTYGGILGDDEGVCAALAGAAVCLAQTRRASVVDLRSAVANAPGFEPVDGYVGFARDLPATTDEVAAFLPKRARAAARHARDRDGVTVRHDAALLPIVWQLYCRSMRRLGSLNYPLGFFESLQTRLGPRAWVSVAWKDERPVCGTVSFIFRDTITPYILGADERIGCEGAANLLYWSVMERAVGAGVRRFDYGRSRAENRGAVGFKKNQGFEPQPLEYQRYVEPGRRAPDLKPSNPRYALARRVWSQLPLPVTRALGVWLSRSVPG